MIDHFVKTSSAIESQMRVLEMKPNQKNNENVKQDSSN